MKAPPLTTSNTRCIVSDYIQAEFSHLASWDTVLLRTLTSSLTSISTTNHHLMCNRSLIFAIRDKRRYGNGDSSQQRAFTLIAARNSVRTFIVQCVLPSCQCTPTKPCLICPKRSPTAPAPTINLFYYHSSVLFDVRQTLQGTRKS